VRKLRPFSDIELDRGMPPSWLQYQVAQPGMG